MKKKIYYLKEGFKRLPFMFKILYITGIAMPIVLLPLYWVTSYGSFFEFAILILLISLVFLYWSYRLFKRSKVGHNVTLDITPAGEAYHSCCAKRSQFTFYRSKRYILGVLTENRYNMEVLKNICLNRLHETCGDYSEKNFNEDIDWLLNCGFIYKKEF